MNHPRHVAHTVIGADRVSTILLSSGDCFESSLFFASGREACVWQTTSRADALSDHALLCEALRSGNTSELRNIYVSFSKVK